MYNLVLKNRNVDNCTGFLLALLLALPVIRTYLDAAPAMVLIFPIIGLLIIVVIRQYSNKELQFNINALIYLCIIVLLFVFLIWSIFWRHYTFSITQDIINIFLIVLLSLSIMFSFNLKSSRYFLDWMIVFAVVATFLLFYQYTQVGNLSGYGITGYLQKSRLIGAGALIAFCKLLFDRNTKNKLYIAVTLFLFVGLALSLARGALLSAVLLAVTLSLYYFYIDDRKSFSIFQWFKHKSSRIYSVLFIGLIIFAAFQIERTAHRLNRLFSGGELTGPRAELWGNSFNGIIESPYIGYGLGSSGMISSGSETYYPHNLFLQVMIDGGIIAAILLLFVCIFPYLRTIQLLITDSLKSYLWLPFLVCYTFLLLEFSKSGNFYTARDLFAFGIVSIIVIEQMKKTNFINRRTI